MGVCSDAIERLVDGELNVRVHEGRKKIMMMKKHNETISGDVGELEWSWHTQTNVGIVGDTPANLRGEAREIKHTRTV